MVCACCHCAEYVEEFKAEHGEVRTSLIEALQQNRRLQESPAQLAVMLSVVDSGKVAGSNPQISDVVDVWIGKKVKDFSLFTMAMGLAGVQGLGRYITCIAQKIGEHRLCFKLTLVSCYCLVNKFSVRIWQCVFISDVWLWAGLPLPLHLSYCNLTV